MLAFALMVLKQWWVNLLAPQHESGQKSLVRVVVTAKCLQEKQMTVSLKHVYVVVGFCGVAN